MAPNVLVMYATTHGQTAKIAGEIAATMRAAGGTVSLGNVVEAWTTDPRDYTAVIMAAPVHAGRFPNSLRQWVQRYRSALASRPTAFVAVCLAVLHRTPKVDQDLRAMLDRFTSETGWRPGETKIVAGALKYTTYNWLTRWMIKRIVPKAGGDVDTSRDFEYTDWDDLRDFTTRFLAGCGVGVVGERHSENPEVGHMKKAVSTLIGVLLLAGFVAAQGHDNMWEKKVKADMSVSAPLRVGDVTLPAGDYKVVCDRTTMTFTRKSDGKQLHQVACKGRALQKKADVTTASTRLDKNGVRILEKLTLRGSTIEHIFD